ncbi:MAG TPA: hypothetical protein VIK94_04280 [Bacilli bacterium]
MEKKQKDINLVFLDHKIVRWIYLIFLFFTVATLISSIILLIINQEDIEKRLLHIFYSTIAIILFHGPLFLKKKFNLYIPSFFQILALVFIYAHFILGEIFRVYDHSYLFDKILHTTSGVGITILGVSVINFLNEEKNIHLKLSPFFVAFFSFCFSLMVAVLWEIFEFTVDELTNSNMQRWKLTEEQIESGSSYLGRIGLIDTMGDLIVAFCGAFVAAVVCYILLKSKNRFINRFLFRRIVDFDLAIKEAEEAHDFLLVNALKAEKEKQKHKKISG